MLRDTKFAINAAKQAGNVIRKNFGKSGQIVHKGFNDYATPTDIKAEKIIIDVLKQTGYSVFGEEMGETDNQTEKKWIIDPIDGTMNFIRGIPFFATSIALIEDNKKLLIGVVYDPIADECYWAEQNKGAYLNDKKIHISEVNKLDGSIVLLEHNTSAQGKRDYLQIAIKLMKQKGPVVLRQGSTALMLCYLARGSAEAFLSSGDNLYDVAGGLIIAREAGAFISDWKGQEWRSTNPYVLAVTPSLRRKILSKIEKIQK